MKTILLVEDEQMLREAYEFLLSEQGYKVVTACDGKEALDTLQGDAPDLILLDLLMPRMDGMQFLQAAHIRKNLPDTIVIVFSNLSQTAKVNELIKAGAKRHVLKAELGPKELVDLIDLELNRPAKVKHLN